MWRELYRLTEAAMSDFLSQDFFSLFGLPESYRLDPDDLEHRYRQLQRAVHPDRHAASAAQDRRLAMQMTARLNDGYTTLRSGLARARYLLERRGCPIEDNPVGLSHDFLFQQMALREEIESLRDAADSEGLQAMKERLREREEAITRTMAERFDRDELSEARDLFYEYQFLARLQGEIDALLQRQNKEIPI